MASVQRAFQLLAVVYSAMVLQPSHCHQSEPNSYIGQSPSQEDSPVLTIPVIIVPSSKKNLFTSSSSKSEIQVPSSYSQAPSQFYNRPPPRAPVSPSAPTFDKRPSTVGRPSTYKLSPTIQTVTLNRQVQNLNNQASRGYTFNSPVPSGPFVFQKYFGQPGGYNPSYPVSSNVHGGSGNSVSEAASRPHYNPAPFPSSGYNAAPQPSFNKPNIQTGGPPVSYSYVSVPQQSFSYNTPHPYTKQTHQSPSVAHSSAYARPSGSYSFSGSQSSGYTNLPPFTGPQSAPAPVAKPPSHGSQPSSNFRRHPVTFTPATYINSAPPPPPQSSGNIYSLPSQVLSSSTNNLRPASSSSSNYVPSNPSPSIYTSAAPSPSSHSSSLTPLTPSIVAAGKIHFGNSASVSSGYVVPGATYSKSFGPAVNMLGSALMKDNIPSSQSSNFGQQGNDYSEDDDEEDDEFEEDEENRESVSYKVVYIPLELLRNILSNNIGLK